MNYAQLKGERITRCDATWIPLQVPLQGMADALQSSCGSAVPLFDCGHLQSEENTQRFSKINGKRVPIEPVCRQCRKVAYLMARAAAGTPVDSRCGREFYRLIGIVAMSMMPCTVPQLSDAVRVNRDSCRKALRKLVAERMLVETDRRVVSGGHPSYVYERTEHCVVPDAAEVASVQTILANRRKGFNKTDVWADC